MKKILTLALLSVFIMPMECLAGYGEGRITNYLVGRNGMLFFQVEQIPERLTCNTEKAWAVNLNDPNNSGSKAIYAAILSAIAQGKSIRVHGNGTCDIWGDRESVDYVVVYD